MEVWIVEGEGGIPVLEGVDGGVDRGGRRRNTCPVGCGWRCG
jgi:hypothetical protein